MNYRKQAFIGLGIFLGGIVTSIIFPFPYNMVLIVAGIVIMLNANSQRKKLIKKD